MTKLPKIEKCVCGANGYWSGADGWSYICCETDTCWTGPDKPSLHIAILAWNRVMKAAKAAKKAKVRK